MRQTALTGQLIEFSGDFVKPGLQLARASGRGGFLARQIGPEGFNPAQKRVELLPFNRCQAIVCLSAGVSKPARLAYSQNQPAGCDRARLGATSSSRTATK
jgi:hypothetical protein